MWHWIGVSSKESIACCQYVSSSFLFISQLYLRWSEQRAQGWAQRTYFAYHPGSKGHLWSNFYQRLPSVGLASSAWRCLRIISTYNSFPFRATTVLIYQGHYMNQSRILTTKLNWCLKMTSSTNVSYIKIHRQRVCWYWHHRILPFLLLFKLKKKK